jgi:hypothetical protein
VKTPVLTRAPTKKNRAAAKKRKKAAPGGENPTPARNRAADFSKSRAYARIWVFLDVLTPPLYSGFAVGVRFGSMR